MRVFVGVSVDDAVRRQAQRVIEEIRTRIGSRVNARWVPLENLHLTVRFIGHVGDDRAPALLDALAHPLEGRPFDIELSGCGRFPPRGAPRVLWIGLTRGLEALAALHEEFNRRVARFGYEPENRPFSAHLTLARVKDAPAASGRNVDEALSEITVTPVVQRVDRVTVFESRLSPGGPRYTPLRELPLRQRPVG